MHDLDCVSLQIQNEEHPLVDKLSHIADPSFHSLSTLYSFVKDTLFPYVRANLDEFLKGNMTADEIEEICENLAVEVEKAEGTVSPEMRQDVKTMVYFLMDRDIKSAVLKGLQGRMWKAGYESGELKGHVYADFKPMLEWTKNNGVDVYIYSSGSIQAQKLLFGNSEEGDLLGYFKGHFDIPTAGSKKESTSYTKIAESIKVDPDQIVFVSDAEAELQAARVAGISQAIMSIRPGNAKLSMYGQSLPSIFSLLQLCGKWELFNPLFLCINVKKSNAKFQEVLCVVVRTNLKIRMGTLLLVPNRTFLLHTQADTPMQVVRWHIVLFRLSRISSIL